MKNKFKVVLFALISAMLLGVKVGNVNTRQEVFADDYFDSKDAPVNYFEDTLPKRIVSILCIIFHLAFCFIIT